jgi:predicted nucleic-acid-binding protein
MESVSTSGSVIRAVDTNVLVRLIVRDDEAQLLVAENFIENGAWISHLVLAETVGVLDAVLERSPAQIAAALDMLLDHKQLTLQEPEVVASALKLYRQRPTLGFSDCLFLEIARKAGHVPLGTFDRNLARSEGTLRLSA